MVLGVSSWTLGLTAYAIGQPAALVLGAMPTHGLFISCYLIAGQVFVNGQAGPDVRASSQGLLVLLSGTGLLAGHLLVGWARAATGDDIPRAFLPAAVGSAALVVLFVRGFTAAPAAAPADPLVSGREMA
jgi:hypothetical protein